MSTKAMKPVYDIQANTAYKFFYQGNHGHPVRRTVLPTQETNTHITGYELRAGMSTLSLKDAKRRGVIRTYRKDEISKMGDYCRLRERKDYRSPNQTTLRKLDLLQLVEEGV
jgi:hypothetical protein